MARAVIFDMDGLLVDSEPIWVRAEIEVFAEVGVALTEADCVTTRGLRIDDVVRRWCGVRETSVPLADVEARLVARVSALVTAGGAALPGVAHALDAARGDGRLVALASSSPRAIIDATLARLGLGGAFDVVASAEREPFGKPHPGVFLTTAAALGVDPTACVVLEDSVNGVIAAKAARMACVAIPSAEDRADARFAIADVVLTSLAEVSSETLGRLATPSRR